MSLSRDPGPPPRLSDTPVPRRGRPPARDEILRHGRLGGMDPAELAARFGTPFYAYDLDVVSRQVAALEAILPTRFVLRGSRDRRRWRGYLRPCIQSLRRKRRIALA